MTVTLEAFELLLPSPAATPQIQPKLGTVTQAEPLRIKLDGDDDPLDVAPTSCVYGLQSDDRVYCHLLTLGDTSAGTLVVVARIEDTDSVAPNGSNSNGTWQRYADGLQICTFLVLNIAQNGAKDWTFPQPFVSAPRVFTTPLSPSSALNGTPAYSVSTTGCSVYANRSNSTATDVQAMAIGQWR